MSETLEQTDGSSTAEKPEQTRPQEELARADAYGLLALLLSNPPQDETLRTLGAIPEDDSKLGECLTPIASVARDLDHAAVKDEFEALFIGIGRGELVPHASFYLTGFLNEKPLAKLRADLKALGVECAPSVKVPEDHIACVCDVMAGIIRGDFTEQGSVCQRTFFERHLMPWAGKFFDDLAGAKNAAFYAPVGRFGKELMRIEDVAFEIAA